MDEAEFVKAIKLLKEFSPLQLAQAKQSLFAMMNDMEAEKKNLSNEVRRSMFYFEISNRQKQKRMKYIDEILLPTKSSQMTDHVNDVFPELRVSSLNKLKAFRRERERLSKTKADHKLRVRQSGKILSVAYAEMEKLQKQYEHLNRVTLVQRYLTNRSIEIEGVIESDYKRHYELFRKEGV